jgi:membrane protein required for colicin V production
MPWLDYVLLGIIAVSALISLARGFVREAFSLAVWILAFWISWQFFRDLELQFVPWISSPTVRLGLAFAALMMVTLLLGGMVNYLLIQLVERTGMSGTDRFIGMLFGAARGALVNTVLVLLAGLTVMPQEAWWQASQLVPYFVTLAAWLQTWLPDDIAQYFQYADQATAATRSNL